MAFVGLAGSTFFWRGEFSAMRGSVWVDGVAFVFVFVLGFFTRRRGAKSRRRGLVT